MRIPPGGSLSGRKAAPPRMRTSSLGLTSVIACRRGPHLTLTIPSTQHRTYSVWGLTKYLPVNDRFPFSSAPSLKFQETSSESGRGLILSVDLGRPQKCSLTSNCTGLKDSADPHLETARYLSVFLWIRTKFFSPLN